MKRYILQLVLASMSIFVLGCGTGNSLPSALEQALSSSSSFKLLSLDPDPGAERTDGKGFHGWNVLGDTVINNSDTRDKLVATFKTAVAENDGTVAACFNPRHGIKVTSDGKAHELVICFECYQVQWYIDGKKTKSFLITDSPQPIFDQVLKNAGVPLAIEPKG